jgi:GDP-mannose 6-dehydrogenase
MNITIVGLGYVGTVSAACLAGQGHGVWGVDVNAAKVRMVNEGRSPLVEPGLDERLRRAVEEGLIRATCNIEEAIRETDLCFVSVATPSRRNGQVDPEHLFRACDQIRAAVLKLRRKQIVVIRSSVLPSVFDQCRSIFESAEGLVHLAVNPEFLREGSAISDFEEPPFTLLGTDNPSVEQSLRLLYRNLPARIFALKPKDALMVKYASNAFHALKVAFANEIAAVCERAGADAEAAMTVFCSDTKLNVSPRYLMPGFAFGGSCLPKDVRAIVYAAKEADLELPLLSAISKSNEQVIARAFEKVGLSGARRVGLVGLSFKPNTDDLRESPFVELAERLLGKGYDLKIYDPNVMVAQLTGGNKEYIERVIPHLSRLLVAALDDLTGCEVVLVGHRFSGVDAWVAKAAPEVIDLAAYGTHDGRSATQDVKATA